MGMRVIAVSACLMGIHCRYNSSDALNKELYQLMKDENLLLFCPEIAGDLPTPRNPAEIVNGDGKSVIDGKAVVMDKDGLDLTQAFINGATETMSLFMKNDVSAVVLNDRSPSCGVDKVYDGSFSGTLVKGCGVLTAMLFQKELDVFSDKEVETLKQWLEQERMKLDD